MHKKINARRLTAFIIAMLVVFNILVDNFSMIRPEAAEAAAESVSDTESVNSEENAVLTDLPAIVQEPDSGSSEENTETEISITADEEEKGESPLETDIVIENDLEISGELPESEVRIAADEISAGENTALNEEPAFNDSVLIDGILISASAGEGVLPEGAGLNAVLIEEEKPQIDEAVSALRAEDAKAAAAYKFDIYITDANGDKIQPDKDKGNVHLEFAVPEAGNTNLKANVYHIGDEDNALSARLMESSVVAAENEGDNSLIAVDTDEFSVYVLEFTYNTLNYTLNGDSETELREVMDALGITGEIEAAVSDDPEYFDVEQNGTVWVLKAIKPFGGEKRLRVKVDGTEYEIAVKSNITVRDPATLKASIEYKGNTVELTDDGSASLENVSWADSFVLNITATFGAGEDKTVEVKIPKELSYRVNYNSIYKVNGLDESLKEQINPPDQAEADKKNETVLGQSLHNGTITLKFNSTGDANDAELVNFKIPLRTAYGLDYNSEIWESGTAWFYDSVNTPITVTQSVYGTVENTLTLGSMSVKNDEGKEFRTSWTAAYNPEAEVDIDTKGDEKFYVRPVPGGNTYPRRTAFKKFSITYLIPEHAEFKGFKTASVYKHVSPAETPAGGSTENGYTVPAGYKALTWTVDDSIMETREMIADPIWKFPSPHFADGDTAVVRVADLHLHYYGRTNEENIDRTRLPSLTYSIKQPYEEVFANASYQDAHHTQNGYYADETLNMGAPGYEFNTERIAGAFTIGNRGLADSVPKTLTFLYDTGDTGYIGVTEQKIPALNSSKFHISNIEYKTWNPATGAVSGWQTYTPANPGDSYINLLDTGVAGDSGIFFKAIRLNIDKIPKQSYLSTGTNAERHKTDNYVFNAKVLNERAVERKYQGEIEHKIVIENQSGAAAPAPVTGSVYNGLSGKSIIQGTNLDYNEGVWANNIKTGETGTVKLHLNFHAWAFMNMQLIDQIYLLSPYGEDFTNIKLNYNWNSYMGPMEKKPYVNDNNENQPVISEEPAGDELKAVYPKARVYKLDFTGINDAEGMYEARAIGGNTLSTDSRRNTPLSSNSRYASMWISFDYKPDISDPTGPRSYEYAWVKFKDDSPYPVLYLPNSGHNSQMLKDKYNFTGNKEQYLGRVNGVTLLPTEGLEVSSEIKQDREVEGAYRSYEGTPETVLGLSEDVDYKLSVANKSSLSVKGVTVYWAVPKAGQNWGNVITPNGEFKFSMNLSNALREVPPGYEVHYAQDVIPTDRYENWDANAWTKQEDTGSWTAGEWNRVNLVRLVWVGTDTVSEIEYGADASAVFDMHVDRNGGQVGSPDIWQPYFRREYTNSISWISGEPSAAVRTPGKLGGKVWNDLNRDGMIDGDEPFLSGVQVELYDISGGVETLRMRTLTDAGGHYEFDGIKDGSSAEAGKDIVKIVVMNPTDPASADAFTDFTKSDSTTDMKAEAAADKKSASISPVEAKPAADQAENMIYHAGLLKEELDYTVEYYYQRSGSYNSTPDSTSGIRSDTSGRRVSVKESDKIPDRAGFVFDENHAANVLNAVLGNDTVLKVYFRETRDIEVSKVWEGERGSSAEISLIADGNASGDKLILDDSNNWTSLFRGLPKYTADSRLIEYTVLESAISGADINKYRTDISGNADAGFTVTNRYIQDNPVPNPGNPSNPGNPAPNPNPGNPVPDPNPGNPVPNPGNPAPEPNPGSPAPNPNPAPNPGNGSSGNGSSGSGSSTVTDRHSSNGGTSGPGSKPDTSLYEAPGPGTAVSSDTLQIPANNVPAEKIDVPEQNLPRLPQTGTVWLPVQLLFAAGMLLIIAGIFDRRKGEADEG